MTPDNQELKKGDIVEILIPEFAKGTTGTLMRSCSNDCVVVAIDSLPRFQCRVNISRHLVRKAGLRIPTEDIQEPEQKPAVIVHHHYDGTSVFYTRNIDSPDVEVDWNEGVLTIDEEWASFSPESVEDLVVTLRTAAQMLIEGKQDEAF